MSAAPRPPARRPAPERDFRPVFLLMLLYFAAFLIVFGLLFAGRDILDAVSRVPLPAGPLDAGDQQRLQEAAREATRMALRDHVLYVVLAALAALGLGVWARVLPGLRTR